jgi:two-component system response regulator (stage 0 sporulation protein A)
MFAITRPRNGRIILDTIKNERPDVVVLEARMYEYDALAVLDEIRREPINSPMPLVIVTANYDSPQVEKDLIDAGARYIMIKPFEAKTLVEHIENFIKKAAYVNSDVNFSVINDDMEYIVTDIIHQIGIPAHIKGYHYLREAILLSIDNSDMINSVTKMLYPAVAGKFCTSPSRVERAIRHAIEIAWDRGDIETLNGFFGYTIHNSRGKPTNSEFVALISDKLRLQYKNRLFAR